MVDSTTKILSLVLLFALISQGYGQCSFKDLYVRQAQTGRKVGEKAEWGAEIINNCTCPQKNVKLNCDGFQTAEPVKPSVISVIPGNLCLVKNGEPVNPSFGGKVSFIYASDVSFPFTPVSSEVSCS